MQIREAGNGKHYFVSHRLKITQWEDPRDPATKMRPLPDGWEIRSDAHGRQYYVVSPKLCIVNFFNDPLSPSNHASLGD